MLVMQEAFQTLLTPKQQKLQLGRSRKIVLKMKTMAAKTAAAANLGATQNTADDHPSSPAAEGLPSPASPLQGLNGADAPSAAPADFLGRRARVGAENDKMFPTDGIFRRVRRQIVAVWRIM
jgi:hypothetical protein